MNPPIDRRQSLGEEIANAVSHGVGFLLAVAALPILLHFGTQRGGVAAVVGASLFSATMMLLYLVSSVYHALPPGRAKQWLNRMDHAAIYLFIAGSYMPFLLGVLRGPWGWTLFGIVWTAAALGVVAKLANRLRHRLWSTGLYVAMGWVALIAAVPLVEHMSGAGLAWLVAGGLAYTAGAAVFIFDARIRYAHFVWHLSATMMLLYLVSSVYHALPPGRAKQWLNRMDHAAIYLFIAGSYMPFLLGVLRGPWGWTLFGIVWTAAALGVVAKLANRLRHRLWSTGLYVAMGWVALIAAVPLVEHMSGAGLAWLVAGGLAYTAGAAVFIFDARIRYAHFVWHLFVLAGSACHFCAALWHAA